MSALEGRRFPVFSTLVALRGATKTGPGTVGRRVVVGDVEVTTGDWVVADADGVTLDVEGARRRFPYPMLGPGAIQVEFGHPPSELGATGDGH